MGSKWVKMASKHAYFPVNHDKKLKSCTDNWFLTTNWFAVLFSGKIQNFTPFGAPRGSKRGQMGVKIRLKHANFPINHDKKLKTHTNNWFPMTNWMVKLFSGILQNLTPFGAPQGSKWGQMGSKWGQNMLISLQISIRSWKLAHSRYFWWEIKL